MIKYIDTDACRDEFMEAVYDILAEDSTNDRANEIIDIFDTLPAADVEPVRHGHWLKDDETGNEMVRCSICHEVYDCEESTELFSQFYHYCPNCGAKMDGGSEDDHGGA